MSEQINEMENVAKEVIEEVAETGNISPKKVVTVTVAILGTVGIGYLVKKRIGNPFKKKDEVKKAENKDDEVNVDELVEEAFEEK